jgi:hypothetical protein
MPSSPTKSISPKIRTKQLSKLPENPYFGEED